MKASVFIATSLDGFIARPDGALDWLPGSGDEAGAEDDFEWTADSPPQDDGEDHGWSEFWHSVDCLVFGRNTFEKVLEFGVWPYEGKRVIVLSRSMTAVPEELEGKAEIYGGDPARLIAQLEAQGHEHIYVDGGQVIQSFLRQGLLDELIITHIPILIGQGIPLFGPLEADIPLRLVRAQSYSTGLVQTTYAID